MMRTAACRFRLATIRGLAHRLCSSPSVPGSGSPAADRLRCDGWHTDDADRGFAGARSRPAATATPEGARFVASCAQFTQSSGGCGSCQRKDVPMQFDLLIIGGGIQGAGIAQAAAAAGFSVLVLEKTALASGTSSRSSKLIHGGLRYLESAQIGRAHV